MRKIYKYPLFHEGIPSNVKFSIVLPKSAIILKIALQNGLPYLWAQIDTSQPKENIVFYAIGTGYELPFEASKANWQYMETLIWPEGDFVLHYYLQINHAKNESAGN